MTRASLPDALRAPIAAWKLLAWLAPFLIGAVTWGLTRASQADVATAVEARAQRSEQSARDALAAHAFADEQVRRDDRKLMVAVLERLVSYEASDGEDDKRRKAEAAAYARKVFRDAIGGPDPGVAAQQAIDAAKSRPRR